jgi:hypothetical protein
MILLNRNAPLKHISETLAMNWTGSMLLAALLAVVFATPIPNSKMVILRDIEKHPANVHYNMAGQLVAGKLFAEAFLGAFGK